MSQLNYLEKLLDGVEVEWKALGEVCDFKNGFAFKSSLFKEAGLPIIRITNVDGKNISLDDVKYFDPSDYKENTASYEISKGDILIAMSGATTGKIGFYAHESPAYLNQRVGKFLPKPKILNNRYLYHYLLSKVEQIYVIAGGGAQPNLSSNALMAKIEIPIPCPDNPEKSLAVQAEIVRVLDAFTAMTAELTAELNMRKKQYNYYRDQLLGFEDGEVEWKALGKIAEINTGQKPSEILDTEAEFDYINAGTTRSGYCALSNCEGDTVTTPSRGQGGIGFVGYQNKSFWLGPLCYKIRSIDNKVLINKYLFYILQSKNQLLLGLKKEGGVPAVNKSDLAKLEVPVPSVTEQERIVKILDKFDTLTTSIQEGLPCEIELRQKQYEYYRDLLLSFPKPEEAAA
ncbi:MULTISPECIES: restriction endonuclease subunit S [Gammaproteobacteria]|uniref:restriction endonuclease subunit S n=1 Tax=Gammaproteobacteria TaxID=1236 RepID=UPI0004E4074D|nr:MULTISPECIES: restriction endonuclease subunit S [Gammaproteobacteria]EAO3034186.1 restriction endonuclease subunit S [Salmonella enterica]EDI9332852.1 restriction endonuclease subunit S [Salmonella enterica subsp. enterica serovar Mbandaka]EJL3949871.1 restriction endonuclease subunit S [Vibrio parahaemolyticus]EAV4017614.1 restriction endonuclease subunit S [Salmonella enterica]EGR1056521.1 restriction endonuclease subunit S [Vibrio cholerae]